jgi:hypothetical protein
VTSSKDGALIEDQAQQRAIKTMRELRAAGASLRAIAAEIERRHGLRTSHVVVARVVGDTAA